MMTPRFPRRKRIFDLAMVIASAPITVPLLALTRDHATGQVQLPAAGTWEMRVTLRLDDINQATVTARIPVG